MPSNFTGFSNTNTGSGFDTKNMAPSGFGFSNPYLKQKRIKSPLEQVVYDKWMSKLQKPTEPYMPSTEEKVFGAMGAFEPLAKNNYGNAPGAGIAKAAGSFLSGMSRGYAASRPQAPAESSFDDLSKATSAWKTLDGQDDETGDPAYDAAMKDAKLKYWQNRSNAGTASDPNKFLQYDLVVDTLRGPMMFKAGTDTFTVSKAIQSANANPYNLAAAQGLASQGQIPKESSFSYGNGSGVAQPEAIAPAPSPKIPNSKSKYTPTQINVIKKYKQKYKNNPASLTEQEVNEIYNNSLDEADLR